VKSKSEHKWPKIVPSLTPAQEKIRNDFVKQWHSILPDKFSTVETFNHSFPVIHSVPGRTLEIGSGLGEHIFHENLENIEYYALELRPSMAKVIKKRFPNIKTIVADCQKHIDFKDRYFDRVIAVHVLEHLPNLPAALKEIRRLLKPSGIFCAVIPCEGGIAYNLARSISAKKIFENKYHLDYDWFIKSEHINIPDEILYELKKYFVIKHIEYFPLKIHSINLNLCIGLTLQPRHD
jgi:SAM-dependent methyltransferase